MQSALVPERVKERLPDALLAHVLDYCQLPDLCRAAQASRRLKRLVYHPARWRRRLNLVRPDARTADSGAKGTLFDAREGDARSAYVQVYKNLAPLFYDLVHAKSHQDPVLFRVVHGPVEQAVVLARLERFSQAELDTVGWPDMHQRLLSLMEIFESAALREFENGFVAEEGEGTMREYAQVLHHLGRIHSCIRVYVNGLPIMMESFGSYADCFADVADTAISLTPLTHFLDTLASYIRAQAMVVGRVFPSDTDAMTPLVTRVMVELLGEYISSVLDESHSRNPATYLQAVAQSFRGCIRFLESISANDLAPDRQVAAKLLGTIYDSHLDLYFPEEVRWFRGSCEAIVDGWEHQQVQEAKDTASRLMMGVNREADKRDFISSFKKMILLPVRAPSTTPTPTPSGRATPALAAPTTELAAQTAIMESKLENIRNLFSLEVALQLIHLAKSSIERGALFIAFGGQIGEEAKEACEGIFVELLSALGTRHIQSGFDQAVDRLAAYHPREDIAPHAAVEPLVTFLELVHVGDLIGQMVDVFYEEELVAPHFVQRHDFLDPAVKGKKKFEQMLDGRVAAGLSKGIEALLHQIQIILSTLQKTSDYMPPPASVTGTAHAATDTSPSGAAEMVIRCVGIHTSLLVGSTDKQVLDVFNTEVGLRLFHAICKHIKRYTVSVQGAMKFISDLNAYHAFALSLKQRALVPYFVALKNLGHIFLIDASDARAIGQVVADASRYAGVFRVEEVYEFAQQRADWLRVKKEVDKLLYGLSCSII